MGPVVPIVGCVLYGGIGQRLFQYASSYGLARRNHKIHQITHVCDIDTAYHVTEQEFEALFKYKKNMYSSIPNENLVSNLRSKGWVVVIEPSLKQHDIVIDNCMLSDVPKQCLYGYFQNEQYFYRYRSELLVMFKEPYCISQYIHTKYPDLEFSNICFIHVRLRGYLKTPESFIDLNTYYKNSIQVMQSYNQNVRFVVFTDDIQSLGNLYSWMKQYPIYCEESDIACLFMMKRCNIGGICANSAFSWWGAWLNTNPLKRVILPAITGSSSILTMKGAMYVSTT